MTFDQLSDDRLIELRQQHEVFLDRLEALAVKAIATGNWDAVYQHLATMQPKRTLQDVLPATEADDAIAFINRLLEGTENINDRTHPGTTKSAEFPR